jgi:hypothetical protein
MVFHGQMPIPQPFFMALRQSRWFTARTGVKVKRPWRITPMA